ncbi:MAG: desulfoferrodoxin FeS4 iron-binding domain-containing protein [Nanoarchaeota archaeon]|nr:desulfoferrodoxin FeS4 iron-binding domain-containing protein [Nanoarchaeota archaeon]
MTEKNQVYRCEVCGNLVKVVEAGDGKLVCCGQPMKLIKKKK